ncbi:MAG TPA: isoprenylcysteine carboxylmethyltransferase family protein, partial [archaeon]|nr:isoprenylcysteine carboxylmethyltransferase family protein [archaeon]
KRTLGKQWSLMVRTLPKHKLITYGIYKNVRHPIYFGVILGYFLVPIFFHSLYGLLITIFIIPIILYRIKIEERVLIAKFGKEYQDYMQHSKKLIPYVY